MKKRKRNPDFDLRFPKWIEAIRDQDLRQLCIRAAVDATYPERDGAANVAHLRKRLAKADALVDGIKASLTSSGVVKQRGSSSVRALRSAAKRASTIYDNVLASSGEIERKDREKKLAKLRERMMWHGVLDDKAVVLLYADELEWLLDLVEKRP